MQYKTVQPSTSNSGILIGTSMHKIIPVSSYSVLTPQMQDIHIHIMPETIICLGQQTSLMVSSLLLLKTLVHGHHWLLDKQ